VALDRIDCALLAALQKDGRRSNKELAADVGLAASSCLARVRRLRAEGILRGVHADLEPTAVGVALEAMVTLRLREPSGQASRALQSSLVERPEVVALYNVSGADDMLVHVAVRDVIHLRRLVWEDIASRPEVGHIETSLVFGHWARRALPIYVSGAP
jgi:DNA-binding Lrp family transcriptional regulator